MQESFLFFMFWVSLGGVVYYAKPYKVYFCTTPLPSPPCLSSYLFSYWTSDLRVCVLGLGCYFCFFLTLTELFGVAYCMPRVFDMS